MAWSHQFRVIQLDRPEACPRSRGHRHQIFSGATVVVDDDFAVADRDEGIAAVRQLGADAVSPARMTAASTGSLARNRNVSSTSERGADGGVSTSNFGQRVARPRLNRQGDRGRCGFPLSRPDFARCLTRIPATGAQQDFNCRDILAGPAVELGDISAVRLFSSEDSARNRASRPTSSSPTSRTR